ncbi:MAG: PIG-L family deacetylase [Defluviitaleaceae bacterium]|nr:PIG-L family deacetylase [Defluviitaleaceae bacterium]
MNILIVASHPDDEVIGVGGTILKHVEKGDSVYVLILCDGKSSRYSIVPNDIKLKSEKETELSSRILGIKKVMYGGFKSNRLDSSNLLDIVKVIESTIQKHDINIIYTHWENDLNNDHRIAFHSTIIAARPLLESKVDLILSFETLSSTEWNFSDEKSFYPNYFVDISEHIEQKISALICYESEMRNFPHPRSIEAIKTRNRGHGATSGFSYAESFRFVMGRIR